MANSQGAKSIYQQIRPVNFRSCCKEEKHKLFSLYLFNIAHILQPTSNRLVWTETYHRVIEMTWNGHPKTCKYIFVAVCVFFFIPCILVHRPTPNRLLRTSSCEHFWTLLNGSRVSFDYFVWVLVLQLLFLVLLLLKSSVVTIQQHDRWKF